MTTDTLPHPFHNALDSLARRHTSIPEDELRIHCLMLIDDVAAYISKKAFGEAPEKCVKHLVAATLATTKYNIPVVIHRLESALLALEISQRPKPIPRKKNPQLEGHTDKLLAKLKQKKTPIT